MKMTTKNSKNPPDTYSPREPSIPFEGTTYALQNGVLFDTLSKTRIPKGECISRSDNVRYTVGDRGFTAQGVFVGYLDLNDGMALIPGGKKGAPVVTSEAPEAAAAPGKARVAAAKAAIRAAVRPKGPAPAPDADPADDTDPTDA